MHRILPFVFCLIGHILYAQYGALDPTFGDGGFTIFPSGIGNDVVVQPDGKILVIGIRYDSVDRITLIRYLPNGKLDPDFGNNGLVLLPDQPDGAIALQLALQADGKILVAGGNDLTTVQNLLLIRYLENGHLDTSFGTNGLVSWDALGDRELPRAIVVQRDGKILLVGDAIETTFGIRAFLVRFKINGDLDTGFGNGGSITMDFGSPIVYATGAEEMEDGKLIVCATYTLPQESISDILLLRFMPDGTPDISFGNNGVVRHDFGGFEGTRQLLLQPDGKIILAIDPEGDYKFSLCRFLPDGKADSDFGENGLVILDFNNHSSADALDIAIQLDGKIIAVGDVRNIDPTFYDELVVTRFLYNGALDLTFGDSGIVKNNFRPVTQDVALAVTLQPDHKIVVTGFLNDSNNRPDLLVARYLSNYEPPPYDTSARDALFQLYPNPTAGAFTVQFGLSRSTTISLDMYDVEGRYIRTLLPEQIRGEGIYPEPLVLGSDIPSGAYILNLIRGDTQSYLPIVKQY